MKTEMSRDMHNAFGWPLPQVSGNNSFKGALKIDIQVFPPYISQQ